MLFTHLLNLDLFAYQVKENQLLTADGMSYLETKHLLLLSYCQSIVYYLLRKAKGLSIEGHPVVRSLVEIRLFLEKVFPLAFIVFIFFFYCLLDALFMDCVQFPCLDSPNRQEAGVSSSEAHEGCWECCKRQYNIQYCKRERRSSKWGGSFKVSSKPRYACSQN